MKNRFYRLALGCTLMVSLTICARSFAQVANPSTDQKPPQRPVDSIMRHGINPGVMLALMTERYKLSVDQQNRIKPILMDREEQFQLLHLDFSLNPDEKQFKIDTILSDSEAKIEAILNDEQKKDFAPDHQEN